MKILARCISSTLKMMRRQAGCYNPSHKRREVGQRYRLDHILGSSAAMTQVRDMIEHAARRDATVLIIGESGTGKELIAKALHFASRRAVKPFVDVNCAALTEMLIESELFGHEKGPLRGRSPAAGVNSNRPVHFFSMKLATCHCLPKPRCCVSCRSARFIKCKISASNGRLQKPTSIDRPRSAHAII